MIAPDMTFAEYLADPSYGSSDLKTFRAGPPAMVPWRKANRDSETPAMRLGTACHAMILTPNLFARDYAIRPAGMDFRTKEGKAWRDEVESLGKIALTSDEADTIIAVANAFESKKAARNSVLSAKAVECSMFWTAQGLPCKGRPDWIGANEVYDLKVTIAADKPQDRLMRHAYDYGWLHQAAHNATGLREHGFRIRCGRLVMVSPKPPYNVQLIEIGEGDLDFLELHNMDTRQQMAKCHASGIWPGTADEFTKCELPASAAFTESDLTGAIEDFPL